jgi:hypothetical protein
MESKKGDNVFQKNKAITLTGEKKMNPLSQTIKKSQTGIKIVATILACLTAAPQMSLAASNESVLKNNEQMKIVPTLGYTYFNIQGTSADYKAKGGNSAAVLLQIPMMNGNLDIESGIEYLETNARLSAEFGFLSIDLATLAVKQIAVPIRAKYTFNPEAQGTHWFGKGGLTPTYLMSAKQDDINGVSTDLKSEMTSIGLLTQAGVGADWGFGNAPGRMSVDVTYSYGLTKAFKSEGGRAAGFQVQAGYAINL